MLDQRAMLSSASSKNSDISGTFRFKYFEKPILPFVEYNRPEIVLDKTIFSQQSNYNDDQFVQEPLTHCSNQKRFRSAGTQSETHPIFQHGDRILSAKKFLSVDDYNHPDNVLQRQKDKEERRKKLPPIVDKETLQKYQDFLDEEEQKEFQQIKEQIKRKHLLDEQIIQERVEPFQRPKNRNNHEMQSICDPTGRKQKQTMIHYQLKKLGVVDSISASKYSSTGFHNTLKSTCSKNTEAKMKMGSLCKSAKDISKWDQDLSILEMKV